MEKDIEISLDEMKKIELDMMSYIDKICRDNNLKYSMMDGSLIGAVRHNGIIPWDDDIDIMMPRPDYEKLKEIFKTLNKTQNDYLYIDSDFQDDFYYPYAKIVSRKTELKEENLKDIKDFGVFVDVFPIDGTYKNKVKRFFQMKKISRLRFLISYSIFDKIEAKTFLKKIYKTTIYKFSQKIGYKKLVAKLQKEIKKCDYDSSEYVAILCSGSGVKRRLFYEKKLFDKIKDTQFDGHNFKIIEKYDEYLRKEFGDYMKFPPEEERFPHHEMDILRYRKDAK